ncbi:MAG: hypothetical protein [Bacteriophage sp.]|nr:MAG: hypothetical protein [Bacteriophage sp.]
MKQEELHLKITQDLNKTYIEKNADYGDAFNKSLDNHGLTAAIVRMEDKMGRFSNLAGRPASMQVEESLGDTLLDLANYAIMTVMWLTQNDKTDTVDFYADGELYVTMETAAKKQRENREEINAKGDLVVENFSKKMDSIMNVTTDKVLADVKNLKPSKKPVLTYEYDSEFNRHLYRFMGRVFILDTVSDGVENCLVSYNLGRISANELFEILEKHNKK